MKAAFGRAVMAAACLGAAPPGPPQEKVAIVSVPELFAPGLASTAHSEIRLTLSPDGRAAAWFSRDRPGGAGGYDIWIARRDGAGWSAAEPAPFNGARRDFDPAFSADGRFLYFASDRPGGLGGDDLYRVPVTASGFGAPEPLGPSVNSAGDEFAPMLSPDGTRLLFSSDRPGGAGGHDLFVADRAGPSFAPARRLSGGINSRANEFDASFLADGATIVFARALDFRTDRVDLWQSSPSLGHYPRGAPLAALNGDGDSYGAMLDWSAPDRLIFAADRQEQGGMDLYTVRYRLAQPLGGSAAPVRKGRRRTVNNGRPS